MNEFEKSLKVEPDYEKEYLLKIQEKIEKGGIKKDEIIKLTQNLTDAQKTRLLELYEQQIEELKQSTEKYKNQIIKTRKMLKKK